MKNLPGEDGNHRIGSKWNVEAPESASRAESRPCLCRPEKISINYVILVSSQSLLCYQKPAHCDFGDLKFSNRIKTRLAAEATDGPIRNDLRSSKLDDIKYSDLMNQS